METIGSDSLSDDLDGFDEARKNYQVRVEDLKERKQMMLQGGGAEARARQHEKDRLTVRERLRILLDEPEEFVELGLLAGAEDEDGFVAGGVVTGIGTVNKRTTAVVAHDATVKAGSHVELTCKKTIRTQKLARRLEIPIVYLVDSSGIFLPRQEEVFADEGHFGSIFYLNSRLSAEGIPQFAAIMGPCVAGGAYLPLLCDELLMVEGANLFIAGPSLVEAAIGQDVEPEELGGTELHEMKSGTVDERFSDDEACLEGLRDRVGELPRSPSYLECEPQASPDRDPGNLYGLLSDEGTHEYDMREVLARIVDRSEFREFRPAYGISLVCGDARIGGVPVGIIANERERREFDGEIRVGGVIYPEDADKAARFIMRCAQQQRPLLFCQDVAGFMVGQQAEEAGIIRRGAKMIHAISNAEVPKVTLVVGHSHGAGNYALCGRAFQPDLMFAWPGSQIGVMGPDQAGRTVASIEASGEPDPDRVEEIQKVYREKMSPYVAADRFWIDDVIDPAKTHEILARSFHHLVRMPEPSSRFGMLQT